MPEHPPQPGRIQPVGRLHQHRFGRDPNWAGRSWVPEATTLAWAGDSSLAVGQGLAGLDQGTAAQGPGGPHAAGGGPGTQPRRRARSQLVRGGGLEALVGAGGPGGVHRGQLGQPVAFQAVQQPPQPKDPLGGDRVSQAGQVLGG
jgi:hypothetical protein